MADIPITREEKYLAYLTGDYKADVPKPITRQERYLYELCLKGMGGEISPEEIQKAVNDYLDKNPVKPGATTEQAAQIEQNKTDIASLKTETSSLKESMTTKIAKFYASNQGETHLADSDDGKIMDMMVYGKSEQKQYSGKNLLNATLQTTTQNGVTCTNNGDGTYTIKGTNNSSNELIISLVATEDEAKIFYNSLIGKKVKFIVESGSTISNSLGRICFGFYNKTENKFSIETYNGGNITVPTGYDLTFVDIHVYAGQTIPETILKPMIVDAEKYPDTTYDDFEPYVGGIPSPNPSYPQEIKSVVNSVVKVCGKNFYTYHDSTIIKFVGVNITRNGSNIILDGTANGNGPEDTSKVLKNVFLRKGTYTFSYNVESGSMTLSGDNLFRVVKSNGQITQIFINGTSNSIEFTLNEDTYVAVICRLNSGSVYNNCKFNIQIELGSTPTAYEPYHEQTVTLPYTLNAIPVSSGGNVTIGGQQYVSDYFDVERGKLVRCVGKCNGDNMFNVLEYGPANTYQGWTFSCMEGKCARQDCVCSHLILISEDQHYAGTALGVSRSYDTNNLLGITLPKSIDSVKQYFIENNVTIFYQLETPIEIDLTPEEIAAFKALTTYYPTTNISVNSEQLDGYTVFNYPISMENGWNYVKQQIGDTRDYIYDMDARTQDTDLQAAEAYVNSEYAVALTELEI